MRGHSKPIVIAGILALLVVGWFVQVYVYDRVWGPVKEAETARSRELTDVVFFMESAVSAHPDLREVATTRPDTLQDALPLVRAILAKKPELAKGRDPRTNAPWVYSTECSEFLDALLDYGADPNTPFDDSITPLHEVLAVDAARVLIEHGADVNAKDSYGGTPLHKAVIGRPATAAKVLELLLNHGADINARDDYGDTPLTKVETNEYAGYHRDVIRLLRANGATR